MVSSETSSPRHPKFTDTANTHVMVNAALAAVPPKQTPKVSHCKRHTRRETRNAMSIPDREVTKPRGPARTDSSEHAERPTLPGPRGRQPFLTITLQKEDRGRNTLPRVCNSISLY